ncbi:MAG TPA: hypothetical protein EYN18_05245, partial [Nitrospirales bacterium]|nr:hypothetical protein [Nitrospirales bacterium]
MRVAVLGCALTICLTNGLSGQEVYREEFEGDSVSWRPEGGDAPYQMTDHQRVSDIAHTGQGSERIRLVASNGTAIYLSHGIPAGSVIGELTSSVWIRSDRPGIQLLLRVVFPRTTDPQTGRPVVTFLRGPASNYSNDWQKLSIDNIPTRIERHLHALRHELQLNIDPREAYVNQAYLNVYGGTGATTVWVDDLQFSGIVRPKALRPSSSLPLVRDNQGKFLLTAEANTKTKIHDVQFQGTVLTVDGRSICPRAIQYQGEPLVHLKQLGFNAVCLSTPPSTTLLAEARQADIWLIAPPPNSLSSPPKIVARPFDPVLAWDLGRRLSRHDLTSLQKLAQHVRGSDPHPGRPILGGVDTELLGYSRTLDILIIGLNPWGTSLELNDYTTWIGQRPRLARPGTPIWAHIQTQTDPRVEEQWETLLESPKIHASVEQNQIEQLTRIGLAAGAHGVFFDSH